MFGRPGVRGQGLDGLVEEDRQVLDGGGEVVTAAGIGRQAVEGRDEVGATCSSARPGPYR